MNVKIKDLQKKILEITLYLDHFCKEHQIQYYLMGGSALGALRHNGFIPWDDDLDVFMTIDNYEKFIRLAKTDLDTEHFHLQEENTKEWPMFYTKLRMNGTTFIEEDTINQHGIHKGVFVDIMCLHNVSNNRISRYIQFFAARLLTAQTLSVRGYNVRGSKFKSIAINAASLFVRGRVKQKLIKIVKKLDDKNTELVGHFFGKASFSKTSFPRKWLGEMRYVPFETSMLPVPSEAEKYLSLRFGDWKKMPDQKTLDEYPVHAYFVDLNKDYRDYPEYN